MHRFFFSKIYTKTFRGPTDILQRIHTNVSKDTQKFFQKDILKFSNDVQRFSNYIYRFFFQDTNKCFQGYETYFFQKDIQNVSKIFIEMFFKEYTKVFLGTRKNFFSKG